MLCRETGAHIPGQFMYLQKSLPLHQFYVTHRDNSFVPHGSVVCADDVNGILYSLSAPKISPLRDYVIDEMLYQAQQSVSHLSIA